MEDSYLETYWEDQYEPFFTAADEQDYYHEFADDNGDYTDEYGDEDYEPHYNFDDASYDYSEFE